MKLKLFMEDETGSITLFVIGILGIMMILFIFVINLANVLAVKEKANTTSQQASMVATSVLYEEVQKIIEEYEEETLEGNLNTFFKDFDDRIQERLVALRNNGGYQEWEENELRLEAIDQILAEELNKPASRAKLRDYFDDYMPHIIDMMKQKAASAITANDGTLSEAKMLIKDERIFIKASNEFQSTGFKQVLQGLEENIFRTSAGPKIDFLSTIWGSNPKEIDLEG